MSASGTPDLSQFSMLDLFRAELETQSQALTQALLTLEREPTSAPHLEAAMRAAHSLKGSARIVELMPAVRVAHAMEECLVAAQHGKLRLSRAPIDALLRGVDLLALVADPATEGAEDGPAAAQIDGFLAALAQATAQDDGAPALSPPEAPAPEPARPVPPPPPEPVSESGERMIRITATSMTRLLGLAGESLIEARRLRPFADSLTRLRREHTALARALDSVRATLPPGTEDGPTAQALMLARGALEDGRQALEARLAELDALDRRSTDLANRLYNETLASRMRPFEDGVRAYARTVRDLAHALGKSARLEIIGGSTGIDRDILDQLDAPLGHLLRNAIDHGLETPEQRRATGKPEEGIIRLEARHHAGLLQILIADDGHGIDLSALRHAVVTRRLIGADAAAGLSEGELLDFLFLPGFSMKEVVSDVSGRGVGLDAVQTMVRQVRGKVRVTTQPGAGTTFLLELPLTLSVIRTLLVDIAGEPYALPLAGLTRTLRVPREAVQLLEGRPHIGVDGQRIGLVTAHELLGLGDAEAGGNELAVVVIGNGAGAYGLVVDAFRGERELVVRPLDPRLGKIKDIAAAALMEDGAPVLIVDMDDLLRSADKLAAAGSLRGIAGPRGSAPRSGASACWWSTIRSPCASWSASCSSITAMRWRWPSMAWMAGTSCARRASTSW
ncbi:chemotaxis protein CheA [Ancylobacter sp. SL191]|uniref:chemotaxis protein CheA n=1 Tax=Ancylobacter sp. SL191 TaxID=2995166 RepID=UPI0022705B6B|nr:chemotaxis protein CheA [Ancylobacter sp. SL191]WAC28493.1 chemotaxis protein CheA [Ancylobacter sp. SL191]